MAGSSSCPYLCKCNLCNSLCKKVFFGTLGFLLDDIINKTINASCINESPSRNSQEAFSGPH